MPLNLSFSSRNHQRTIESIQASLETETKGKADALRIKKKLEQDINELEVALDQANRCKADAERAVKNAQKAVSVSRSFIFRNGINTAKAHLLYYYIILLS